jgi:hypothetical protein
VSGGRHSPSVRYRLAALAISPLTEPCATRQGSRVPHRLRQQATRTETFVGERSGNRPGTFRTSPDQRSPRRCIGEQLRQTHRPALPTCDHTSVRLRERHSQTGGGSGPVYPLRRSIRVHVSSWLRPRVGSRISSRRRAASRSTQSGSGIGAVESPRSSHKSSTSRSFSAGGSARSSSVFIGTWILQSVLGSNDGACPRDSTRSVLRRSGHACRPSSHERACGRGLPVQPRNLPLPSV